MDATRAITETIDAVVAQRTEDLVEQIHDLALRLDEVGWEKVAGMSDELGLPLEALKNIHDTAQDMDATSPVLGNAINQQFRYVFGAGVEFTNTDKPRIEKVMKAPFNKTALFTTQAFQTLTKARATDGNIFILVNQKTKEIYRIPINEITGYVCDPFSSERVWFFKRTRAVKDSTGTNDTVEEWYKTYSYTKSGAVDNRRTISDKPVNKDFVIHFFPANKMNGHVFGVPDAYAAITWVMAYSAYLKNNSRLVEAYAKIAYKISTPSKGGGQQVAAAVGQPGSGGVATMGLDTTLTAVPATGSQVSFDNGRALAAQVAAAFGISVVALLSDPGAAGSSYGSAQTLDTPTIKSMTALQSWWKEVYEELFESIGGGSEKPVECNFPNIEDDAPYRAIAALSTAFNDGALFVEEYREEVLKVYDITPKKTGLPVPPAMKMAQQQQKADAAAAQANSNDVGKPSNGGETDNNGRTDLVSGNQPKSK